MQDMVVTVLQAVTTYWGVVVAPRVMQVGLQYAI